MIRVMIADDHEIVRRGIRQLLEDEADFVVSGEAANGHEALRLLENGTQTDVLLADVCMPGMDGLALVASVRERFPDVKLVMLTMQEEEDYVQKAFEAGIHNYLFKTSGIHEVVFGLRQAVSGKPYICSSLTTRIIQRVGAINASPNATATTNVEFSKREMEVLELIAQGLTNEEAADKLFTSRRTVEGHRQSMIDKTGCKNSLALIRFAMRNGLLN